LDIQLKEVSANLGGRILIIDSNKKVIYDSFNNLRGTTINQKEVVSALNGEAITNEYILDKYENTLYTSVPLKKNGEVIGVVLLSTSLLEQYTEIYSIRNNLIFISVMILVFITLINIRIANSGLVSFIITIRIFYAFNYIFGCTKKRAYTMYLLVLLIKKIGEKI